MSYRSVIFVPAAFACVVAAANIAGVTDLRAQQVSAQAAEAGVQVAEASASCLSAPKGATPAGSHWYYRIDRVSKRQCWYLREESEKSDDKFTRAAPPASAPASTDTSQAPLPTPRKFSEARAEWVAQQSKAESDPPVRAQTRSIAATPPPQDDSRAAMPNVLAPSPLSSMRWNETPAAGAAAAQNPPPVQMAAAAVPAVQQQQPRVQEVQQDAAEQPYAPVAAETVRPTVSLQKLLLAIAAALALAGVTASAVVRIGRMRARRAMKRKRNAMWETNPRSRKKRSPQPAVQEPDARPRRAAPATAAHPARAPELNLPELDLQELHLQDLHLQDRAVHERPPQDRPPQERPKQERPVHPVQDRPMQDRARAVRERPRTQPERSYAPPDRRTTPQQDRAQLHRAPQERAPQEREHQVSEMLSRLARSAQH